MRNFLAPQWEQSNYNFQILETQVSGIPFAKINANDRDGVVSAA
jgi:hypothetical protein